MRSVTGKFKTFGAVALLGFVITQFQGPALADELLSGRTGLLKTIEQPGVSTISGSISLDRAIEIALDSNLELRASRKELEESTVGKKIAIDSYDFASTYSFNYIRREAPTLLPTPGMGRNTYVQQLSFGKPLYNKNIEIGISLAELNVRASTQKLRKTSQGVIYQVYNSYLQVLKALELISVYENNVKSHEAHLELVRNQMKESMRTRADLIRFEVELANGQFQLETARVNLTNAMIYLKRGLGVDLESAISLEPGFLDRWKEIADWVLGVGGIATQMEVDHSTYMKALTRVMVETMLESQPDVRLLDIQRHVAAEALRQAKAGLSPTVALSLTADLTSSDKFFDTDLDTYKAALAVQQPLFDSGSVKAQTRKARKALERVMIQTDDSLRLLKTSCLTTLNNIYTASRKVQVMEKSLEQARENLRIMEERYSEGLVSNVDLIDSQNLETGSRSNYITALYDFYIQYANFLNIMGVIDHVGDRIETEHKNFLERLMNKITELKGLEEKAAADALDASAAAPGTSVAPVIRVEKLQVVTPEAPKAPSRADSSEKIETYSHKLIQMMKDSEARRAALRQEISN